jgi:hypothetical protein
MGPSSTPRAALVPIVAALLAVATLVSWTLRAPFPLLNDDVAYLGSACAMASLDSLEWGPAYAAAYCALRKVVPDPFVAFWLKQAMVLLLGGVLVAAVGRRHGLGPVVAPLAGLWCVLALLSPNGTLESAFVLCLGACLCASSDTPVGWAGFFLLMGFAFLVRTEYVIGIAAALALVVGRGYRRPPAVRGAALAGILVLASCLALAWGARGDRGRSWFAFGQQFAVNHSEAFGTSTDPLVDWPRIAAQSFPASDSILEAARENPRVFFWHVRYNLSVRVPRALARLLLPVPFAANWPSPWAAGLGAGAMIAVLAAAFGGARQTRSPSGPSLVPLMALTAIPLVSLVFRPQARHLLPLLPLLVVLAGRALGAPFRGGGLAALRAACACLLLGGLAAPWATWAMTAPDRALEARLRVLREAARTRPVRVRASWYADRICALVGPRCEVVDPPVDADVVDAQ